MSATIEKREEEAIAQFQAGNNDIAQAMFFKLLEEDPKNITAHFHLALLHYEKSEFQLALEHAKTVLQLNPTEANAHLNIGCIYDKQGDIENACTSYRKELLLNPGSWAAWSNLGRIAFEKRDYTEAARCLEKSFYGTRLNRDRSFLAESYSKSGQLEKEIQLYRSCLDRDKDDLWALDNLGAALIDTSKPKLALYFLNRAKKLSPPDERIERNISRALQALKRVTH